MQYNLECWAKNIEDNPDNVTRFAVIGQKSARDRSDKMAVMFEVEHRPGALAEAMNVFKRNRLNLTWIESFPSQTPGKPEYIFFVDFEGHQDDPKVNRTLKALAEHCEQMTILGSFPMALTVGG